MWLWYRAPRPLAPLTPSGTFINAYLTINANPMLLRPGASHAASMARLDQSLMKDIGRDLTEQVRTIGGMGAWWTRVRDDICALGVDEDVLTNYTQAELNSLRGRWQGMHNELKANAALLGFATNGVSPIMTQKYHA
jgi:hypothetical protein